MPGEVERKARLYRRFDRYLSGGNVLVELGCGDGGALDQFHSRYRIAIGIDGSLTRFRMRSGTRVGWSMVLADLNRPFPLRAGSVDAVFLNQVIEHLADPRHLADEVRRLLKADGIALVTTPNLRYLGHLQRLVMRGRGPRTGDSIDIDGPWDNGHIHYFTHSDLREIFLDAGFKKVESRALVNLEGARPWLRNLLDRRSSSYIVREFLSGNILLTATK
ncbi:class I SAM-dependent methyltransferase [Candidatus Binatus sp.]|uniref:class I SAM-dependent methyltransferase n=1 Tax=Candidatus Binatus sp. TaxID=2811406 RepID=UPI002729FA5B|nr:class I SAM-dependent methyltransferase [Candidatus Binatus sp.]